MQVTVPWKTPAIQRLMLHIAGLGLDKAMPQLIEASSEALPSSAMLRLQAMLPSQPIEQLHKVAL